jgi:hypothetical protein
VAKNKPALEKSPEVKEQEAAGNNRCFIITPIGDHNSEMRRSADGLIDAAIKPVLRQHRLLAEVAHRNYDLRSITGRIVEHVVESKLVIANLTGLNPNVMYELAVRHAARKPVIVIAEFGTSLPFDLKDELAIFYRNDMRGVLELRKSLNNAISQMSLKETFDNPVMRYTRDALIKTSAEGPTAMALLFDRIDDLSQRISDSHKNEDMGTSHSSAYLSEACAFLIESNGVSDRLEKSYANLRKACESEGVVLHGYERVNSHQSLIHISINGDELAEYNVKPAIYDALVNAGILDRSALFEISPY